MDRRPSDLILAGTLALALHGALLAHLGKRSATAHALAAEVIATAPTRSVTLLDAAQADAILHPTGAPAPARMREARVAPHPPAPDPTPVSGPRSMSPASLPAQPPMKHAQLPPRASTRRARIERLAPGPVHEGPPPEAHRSGADRTLAPRAAADPPPESRAPAATHARNLPDLASSGNLVLRRPPLAYPERERRRGIQGLVRVGLEVRPDGKVARAWVLRGSGSETLDGAALANVRAWVFDPVALNEAHVGNAFRQDVRFSLR